MATPVDNSPQPRTAGRKKTRNKPPRIRVIWNGMKSRCLNPNSAIFPHYGGRGIIVCQEWIDDSRSFIDWATANGYRDDLTLDRIDNNGNYEPGNCRWVTMKDQALNRRSATMLTAFGETKNISLWAEDPRAKVRALMIRKRLRNGWHPEDAIVTPQRERGERERAAREAISFRSEALWPGEIGDEIWKVIPISEGYEASDMGRIRSYRKCGPNSLSRRDVPIILNPRPSKDGRLLVTIVGKPKNKFIRVPILVLMAHVGMPEPGQQACHFPDPNPANCRLSNLYWGSQADNNRDKTRVRKILFADE